MEQAVRKLIEERVAPSAAAAVAASTEGVWVSDAAGATDAYFDLASLTKPMTALAIAWSGMDVRAPLGELVDEARGTPSAEVPLELFLAHRAGLEAHLPIYEWMLPASVPEGRARAAPMRAPEVLAAIARARREDATGAAPAEGFAPVYSDLGYILAGVALARRAGVVDAGDAIERLVALRLGLEEELGTARGLAARGVDLRARAEPTEDVAWRGGVVRGVVHDENAWALTGPGGSGHAGMFGTARAVVRFGCAALDALESDARLAWMVRERPGGTLRAGWDGKSAEGSSAGTRMGPRAFGHLGFTGTSLWIDPDLSVVVALLTNRVHPTREHIAIRAARPAVHDALVAHALALRA